MVLICLKMQSHKHGSVRDSGSDKMLILIYAKFWILQLLLKKSLFKCWARITLSDAQLTTHPNWFIVRGQNDGKLEVVMDAPLPKNLPKNWLPKYTIRLSASWQMIWLKWKPHSWPSSSYSLYGIFLFVWRVEVRIHVK